jgi:hypothetical protein
MNRESTWHWLGGWGCRPEAFAPFLEKYYSGVRHLFYDVHERLEKEAPDFADVATGDLIIAFSLGSLVAHRWREAGNWPEGIPLISLSPVFDFASQGKGWSVGVRASMTSRLSSDVGGTLDDFWKRMIRGGPSRPDWRDAFRNPSFGVTQESLSQGLEFLWNQKASAEKSCQGGPWGILFSPQDAIAGLNPESLPSGPSVLLKTHSGGHIPFLQHPHALRALAQDLLALSGKADAR